MMDILKIMDQPNEKINLTINDLKNIEEGLQELNLYTLNIKECWESLESVMSVKSILGLLDEFKFITKILDSELFDNPALNCGLYRVD